MPLIERNLADLRAVGLGDTPEDVLKSLRKVRKAGFCVAYGEVTPGAVGIAAPVVDDRDYPIASVCVTIAGNLVKVITSSRLSMPSTWPSVITGS